MALNPDEPRTGSRAAGTKRTPRPAPPLDSTDTDVDGAPGAGASEARQLRKISDATTLRALAHPVRIALFEALGIHGPMTATEVGERIGESPTTCSFHLRQLGKYGFVEEAGGGKGRARPWKLSSVGMRFSSNDANPETALVAGELARIFYQRQLDRYETWLRSSASYPDDWRNAASQTNHVAFMTAEELEELNDELLGIVMSRFLERVSDPSTRPKGALPVELHLLTYPIGAPHHDEEVGS